MSHVYTVYLENRDMVRCFTWQSLLGNHIFLYRHIMFASYNVVFSINWKVQPHLICSTVFVGEISGVQRHFVGTATKFSYLL